VPSQGRPSRPLVVNRPIGRLRLVLEDLENFGYVGELVTLLDLHSCAARVKYIDSGQFLVCGGAIDPNGTSARPYRLGILWSLWPALGGLLQIRLAR
jgi:hypothetical protein